MRQWRLHEMLSGFILHIVGATGLGIGVYGLSKRSAQELTMRLPRLRTVILTALLVFVTAGFATTHVSAHSRPLRFDPAPGAVLQAAPASVTGYFTSDIPRDPNWSFIQVTDAQAQRVDTGETALNS